MKIIETAIAALIAALILTVVHLLAVWSNGKLRRLSEPPMSYIVGIIPLGVPYVALLRHWGAEGWYIYAFMAIVGVGGAPIIIGHIVKRFADLRKENEILRGGLDGREERRRMGSSAGPVEGGGREPPWGGGVG